MLARTSAVGGGGTAWVVALGAAVVRIVMRIDDPSTLPQRAAR